MSSSPSPGAGQHGVASQFGSLDGWSLTSAENFLQSLAPAKVLVSASGYITYYYQDGSKVIIGPDLKIDRLPWIDPATGARPKGYRLDPQGNLARPHTFVEEQLIP
jgi:hypothetical protein